MRHPSKINTSNERAEALLAEFFTLKAQRRAPATRQRYERVHRHLLTFLAEADMSGLLDTHENAIVATARRDGAGFFSVLDFDAFIACLPGFLKQQWLLNPPIDARAQRSLVEMLVDWADERLADEISACTIYSAREAIRDLGEVKPADRPRLTLLRGGLADDDRPIGEGLQV